MDVGDAPALVGATIDLGFPAAGQEWLAVLEPGIEFKIKDGPGRVASRRNHYIGWLELALGEVALEKTVEKRLHLFPGIETLDGTDEGDLVGVGPEQAQAAGVGSVDDQHVLVEQHLDVRCDRIVGLLSG